MYHWEVRFLHSASLRFRRNDGGRGPAFYNLRPKGATTPSAREGCRPLSEAMQPFYTTRGGAAPLFVICARRAPPQPFEPSEPYEPSEPSRRRCVHWCPSPWSYASAPPKGPHYFLLKNFTISWGISFFRSMAGRSPWSRYVPFSERRVSM